jgi:hypothetical protein
MAELRRTNGIAPTKQAEIEAAYAALNADEIGAFNAEYLRGMICNYLHFGTHRNDEELLAVFNDNLSDIRPREAAHGCNYG